MHLPHLLPFENATVVFITTCTSGRKPTLATGVTHDVLHDVWQQSAERNGWYVGQYVLMPDHVHLFACPGLKAIPLPRWMQLWKSISAKRIHLISGQSGSLWQSDYFDRFIRSKQDHIEKWNYVALNPVRRGFVDEPENWPYRGIIHDLRCRSARD